MSLYVSDGHVLFAPTVGAGIARPRATNGRPYCEVGIDFPPEAIFFLCQQKEYGKKNRVKRGCPLDELPDA